MEIDGKKACPALQDIRTRSNPKWTFLSDPEEKGCIDSTTRGLLKKKIFHKKRVLKNMFRYFPVFLAVRNFLII